MPQWNKFTATETVCWRVQSEPELEGMKSRDLLFRAIWIFSAFWSCLVPSSSENCIEFWKSEGRKTMCLMLRIHATCLCCLISAAWFLIGISNTSWVFLAPSLILFHGCTKLLSLVKIVVFNDSMPKDKTGKDSQALGGVLWNNLAQLFHLKRTKMNLILHCLHSASLGLVSVSCTGLYS